MNGSSIVFEASYERIIKEQAYRDGKPLFRDEAIGVPMQDKAYFVSAELAAEKVASWSDGFYEYKLTGYRYIKLAEVPSLDVVHFGMHDTTLVYELRAGGI